MKASQKHRAEPSGIPAIAEPRWTIRRRVVFGTLGFCAGATLYLMVWADSDPLRETIANAILLLAGTVITGYVFGATWDDNNYRNAIIRSAEVYERRTIPGETPDDFAG